MRLSASRRICRLDLSEAGLTRDLGRAQALGFDAVLVEVPDGRETGLAVLAEQARAEGLGLYVDLALQRFGPAQPSDSEMTRAANGLAADPRWSAPQAFTPCLAPDGPAAQSVVTLAVDELRRWAVAGVEGVRALQAHGVPPALWRDVIEGVRRSAPAFAFIADTQTAPRDAVLSLAGCGFDALVSSLPWWDGRARWFVEEHEALRTVAPLIADASLQPEPGQADAATAAACGQRLMLAAATGVGLIAVGRIAAALITGGDARGEAFRAPGLELSETVQAANALSRELSRFDGEMRLLTGEGARVTVLLRSDAPDVRRSRAALLVMVNPDLTSPAGVAIEGLLAQAGAEFGAFACVDGAAAPFDELAPGEVRLLVARRSQPISIQLTTAAPASALSAAQAPRLVVEGVSPRVEGGDYPVRRVAGETVRVEADVFADGHEQLAAEALWRALDEPGWTAVPMRALANDRWEASFPLDRVGRYEFIIEAWLDVYGGFRRDFAKKRDASVAQPVDVQEGRGFIQLAAERSSGELKTSLKALLARLKGANGDTCGDILLDDETARLMRAADDRPFRLRSPAQLVDAERLQARFASWYELFPRSQTSDAARHGTFDDVVARLPAVRAMGFDVLYFPPIHPIGRENRKGRNNSLIPGLDDPGSPYAIGSEDGGHDAIHPQLGGLEGFRRLMAAAAAQGLEVALDFAVQCSPDHPWLKEHPGWFDWRPDGSIKYAENPPKKYQDIVNVDFYKPQSLPDLWLALRDIVLLWVGEGVRLFRVDNPHTKPLPFWEWMIDEVRASHPDVVFLAEAFTRPKVMYRLAKVGFSQSYTYFTWRHDKHEFIDYLTELTEDAPKEFFRPHFFVNTPDINPVFLQRSGRGGFLIRAALASTLSGLWGVYSGFELLEAEPLPGKEEYADSEKYEIRPRPGRKPGDIVMEISRLNRIRKGHPALQTHLGVTFLQAWNDKVLVYAKATAALDDVVVVAVSLDPHAPQETGFDLPFSSWNLAEGAAVEAEDLVWEQRYAWSGASQHVRLDPDQPYAIWSLRLPVA